MVRKNVLCEIEPEAGHLGQYFALSDNLVLQNDIECRDTVGCNHNERVINIIDLSYFAFLERFEFLHTFLLR